MSSLSKSILDSLTIGDLSRLADKTEYKPDILEKIAYLQAVLSMVNEDPFLSSRLVLKGGTALNLYYLDTPRLSVDLDFNYIGTADRQIMQEERAEINQIFTEKSVLLGLTQERFGNRHAGGKTVWRYPSAFGHRGTLEVDLNFMHRVHFSPTVQQSTTFNYFGFNQPVHLLDIHEVAAGKIMALQSRDKSRDVFDVAMLAQLPLLDHKKLRLYTVLYAAMDSKEPNTFRGLVGRPERNEFREQLKPLLKTSMISQMKEQDYIDLLVTKSNELLKEILPFSEQEQTFLTQVKAGKIQPDLLTGDTVLQANIERHPGIMWHASGKRLYVASLSSKQEILPTHQSHWFQGISPSEMQKLLNSENDTLKKIGNYLKTLTNQHHDQPTKKVQSRELLELLTKSALRDPILSPLIRSTAPVFSQTAQAFFEKKQVHSQGVSR